MNGGSLRNYLDVISPCLDAKAEAQRGRDLPNVTQQNWDFGGKNIAMLTMAGLSFPFCLNHESPGGWRGDSPGDMTVECVGETRCLLFQAPQANRPMCGEKGLWLSATASVSFGLSTPTAKCSQRVRLDKGGKVRGWRWQDFRDQSLREVPEPLLLSPPQSLEGQQEPPSALHSPGSGPRTHLSAGLGLLHLRMDHDKTLELGC